VGLNFKQDISIICQSLEKFIVKISCEKQFNVKFLSLLASDKNFYSENFFSSSWVLFHQFQLDKKLLHIRMEVCERNCCVCVTIATRDVIIGKQWLKCDQITKVMIYTVYRESLTNLSQIVKLKPSNIKATKYISKISTITILLCTENQS